MGVVRSSPSPVPSTLLTRRNRADQSDHEGGQGDVGPSQYADYWHSFDNNCPFFKENQVGWFIHTWQGEGAFDMLLDDGSYEMPGFKPQVC